MSQESAEHYAQSMIGLSFQARSVIRDLNPKVRNANSQYARWSIVFTHVRFLLVIAYLQLLIDYPGFVMCCC